MSDTVAKKNDADSDDLVVIELILSGSRSALETLVARYQRWIYNVALKMTLDPQDAEDVCQEILIKLITKLAAYDSDKGLFRTWLYRIVANHVINMKTNKYERMFSSFDACASAVEQMPDESIEGSPEQLLLIEELKIKCMTGTLLCLDRKHRLVFIMSEIFSMNPVEGKEMLDVTDANYRKILSRARKRVYNFINQNCGLIHPDNPCHCHKKLKSFIRAGFVDPNNMLFYDEKVKSINEAIRQNRRALQQIYPSETARDLLQRQPFYDPPNFDQRISDILQNDMIGSLM